MWKWIGDGLGVVKSGVLGLPKRIATDFYLDLKDGIQWSRDFGSKALLQVVEKWMAFWYAFFFAVLVGWVGHALLFAAEWAYTGPFSGQITPFFVVILAGASFFIMFYFGMLLFGIVIVSVARFLFWLKDGIKNYWEYNTPRYTFPEDERESLKWPPDDAEIEDARRNLRKFGFRGVIWFPIFLITVLGLETAYPDRVQALLEHPSLNSITEIFSFSLWIFDLSAVVSAIGVPINVGEALVLVLVFIVPSIFFIVASRNLLFLFEIEVRNRIERAINANWYSISRWKFIGMFFFLSLWGIGVIISIGFLL